MGEKILSLLRVGRENARTTEELCNITGLHKRVLQKEIHNLREAGHLIISLSDVKGYFLPADRNDVASFKNQMLNRAIDIFKAIKSAKEYLGNLDEQIEIEETAANEVR